MCPLSSKRLIVSIVLLLLAPVVGASEYYGDAPVPAWHGEFPPEGYNPYLPNSRPPVQQMYRPPFTGYPQSPVPVQSVPQLMPRLPASPVVTTPEYFSPQAIPLPPATPYSPGLYAPSPGLYPGYFYPFNNSQFVAPFF